MESHSERSNDPRPVITQVDVSVLLISCVTILCLVELNARTDSAKLIPTILFVRQPRQPMKAFASIRQDLPASIVVFFVAVPLCLGIALASGAPLFAGLIAGIIGGLICGILSGSPLGVSGPAAGLAVIVLQAIEGLGFEAFLLAVFLSGFLQMGLGFARAGVLGYFFPSAVIRGMLAGIGTIIVLKQIPHAFGWDKDPEGEMQFQQPDGETTLSELSRAFENIEWNAAIVATVGLALLLVWDNVLSKRGRFFQVVQGPLVAVAFGIVYQLVTSQWAPSWSLSPEHLVSVPTPNSFDELLTQFTTPDWGAISNGAVWVTAVTIAIVGSLETLLCLEATDKLDPQKRVTPTNRELVAQGVGNSIAGAIGGLPITQVIVRSSANIQSGARTKLSAILHGAFLLLTVVMIPQVLNLVPLPVLASILFVVGYKLAKPQLFATMYRNGWTQFVPFVVTVVGIVFTDLLTGIGLGMAVAAVVILRRNYLNSYFLHIEENTAHGKHEVHMRLSEEVTFLNKGAILRELSQISDDSVVIIDTSKCVDIDLDVVEIIEDFRSTAGLRGIRVETVSRDKPEQAVSDMHAHV
ncbi:MAG: MFS superfamily sulfate permease-like transporter [Planctomycetota bacterium]|jgi:MFS superfamily sulfate permease-like transporter